MRKRDVDTTNMFEDPLHPTEDEIRAWMLVPSPYYPTEEWDMVLGDIFYIKLIYELASLESSHREDAVHFLYVATEDCFHNDPNLLRRIVENVPNNTYEDLLEWQEKAKYLLEKPHSFIMAEWRFHITK